jgi:hypothetical protein
MATYSEIKKQLLDEWEQITEDSLYEIADGLVPIYHSDTLEQWRNLSMDESDTWQETNSELSPDTTIFSLMSIDLFNHYLKEVEEAFAEVAEEKQEEENERE